MKRALILGILLLIALFVGFMFRDTLQSFASGTAVDRGLARVVVYGECDPSDNDIIVRSFNNVNSKQVTIRPSTNENRQRSCIVNIGSKAANRYMVATWENNQNEPPTLQPKFVTVSARESDPNEIRVTIFNADGTIANGFFYLVVY